ncbi:BREX-1 system adenine-specific DNA-methyltransferase PglX [Lysinibacillus sp. NPDC097195]|uniref:BREX-1 system adenine-specific DNA-methyltransferase PglX n=1 Tax=Lysinibacillus sp. NPDC097195 TaxID=3364141 RepID=UPI003806FD41
MNKSALKKFATEARKELLERVELQARKIGITADSIQKATVETSDAVFIDGRQLSDIERRQRNKLIKRIEEIGFNRVMEETAYTWFNRFIALRFMEVNDYLPTKVRVLSSYNADSAEPDMMKEALSLDLDLDKEYIYELKMANKTDELFKYLIKVHCNDLSTILPFMFDTNDDYKQILFPDGLLGTDSFVRQLTNREIISESDWENVEIIGWLYQYYISEEKDEVFANLKKNIKISKDKIPAATQLFTPKWIVRYMVENSLGKIWIGSYPNSESKKKWKYYLDEAEQDEDVIKTLDKIRYKNVSPEEITFLDPCCGSGHILVYAFDIFYEMYLDKGYVESEIPQLILSKNLFGLDIDDRAVQLASFAVMMKARSKSRKVFKNMVKPNIYAIQESNWITDELIEKVAENNKEIQASLKEIHRVFYDAKDYGSILKIEPIEVDILEKFITDYKNEEVTLFELLEKEILIEKLPNLIQQSKLLSEKYDVVCTNPPYMGNGGMDSKLLEHVKKYYPDSKNDLGTVFMEVSNRLTKRNGYYSIINIPSWMFLSSFEELRKKIIYNSTFSTLLHLGRGIFGADFGTTAFVIQNSEVQNYRGSYKRLFESPSAVDSLELKEKKFFDEGIYINQQQNYLLVNGNPIIYWAKNIDLKNFEENKKLNELAVPKVGLQTGSNDTFLRFWHETDFNKIGFGIRDLNESLESNYKWFPYNKGGAFRKWYGNGEYVVNWESDGFEIRQHKSSVIRSPRYYLKEGLTWSKVTIGGFSIRYIPKGYLFDVAGCSIFFESNLEENIPYFSALLNSKVAQRILSFLSPTVNYEVGHIGSIPIKIKYDSTIIELSNNCIALSKEEWDSYESSWDFKKHPILLYKEESKYLNLAFDNWERYTFHRFNQLKQFEENINRYFIELYELDDEISPEIEDEKITLNKADKHLDIISFISYAMGCSFGRYSLDEEGLIYAGGEFDASRYKTFPVDEDNILPILPGAYFEDDIVTKFLDFVRITFSEETLEENLDFIADAIGRKKNETAREAIRRYFLNDFYKDHVQTYKKRPIYWLFTSGKEKAFNCLIYMHRYDKTTLSRIRTDYLHPLQTRMDAEKKDLLSIIEGDYTTKEINDAKKELKSLDKKIDELKTYDEKLHHMADMQIGIDLDDRVKHNYDLFKGLVAKI